MNATIPLTLRAEALAREINKKREPTEAEFRFAFTLHCCTSDWTRGRYDNRHNLDVLAWLDTQMEYDAMACLEYLARPYSLPLWIIPQCGGWASVTPATLKRMGLPLTFDEFRALRDAGAGAALEALYGYYYCDESRAA